MKNSIAKDLFPQFLLSDTLNDKFLDSLFERSSRLNYKSGYRKTSDEDGWKIEIPFPGSKKDDVKISIKEKNLTIENVSNNPWILEKNFTFILPHDSTPDGISAEMENGLLTVYIRKNKSKEDVVIKIK